MNNYELYEIWWFGWHRQGAGSTLFFYSTNFLFSKFGSKYCPTGSILEILDWEMEGEQG